MSREDQIVDYLAEQYPGATDIRLDSFRRMPEGWSRESYMFDLAFTDADGQPVERSLVLRIDPPGSLIYTDRSVEFNVMRVLHGLGYPVPGVLFLETDGEALGAPFMVMDKLEGTASPDVLYADDFSAERAVLGDEFIRLLAELHALDPADHDLPFDRVPSPEEGIDQALAHWEATLHEQKLEPQPFLVESLRWLRANRPAPSGVSLLHGDYRSGNFMFEGDTVTGIVDWELASLGDPLQDLGWAFMDLWVHDDKICGFFERDEMLARYEKYAGTTVDREALNWWEVFNYFKFSIIGLTGTRTRVLNLSDEINYSISHLYLPPFFKAMVERMGM